MAIKTKNQTFKSAGKDWQMFVATPDEPEGAVIVIHEIWSLNDDIKRITRDFAKAGYFAVAPNLYSHAEPVTELSDEVFARVFGDPFRKNAIEALHDLKTWIAEQGWSAKEIAAVGFCFGGTYALQYLLTHDDIAGAVSFYGQAPDQPAIQKLQKPVLAFYGEDDEKFDSHRDQMIEYSKEGLPIEVKTYTNAAHSFMNKHHEGTYKPYAASDAWQRTLNFLTQVTKS